MQSPHIRCTSATPSRPQEIRSFEGFYVPWEKQLLFYALGVLSFGLVFLLAKWSPKVHIALNLRRCPLKEATFVRITLDDGRVDVEPVVQITGPTAAEGGPTAGYGTHHVGGGAAVGGGREEKHRLLEYRCNRGSGGFNLASLRRRKLGPPAPVELDGGVAARSEGREAGLRQLSEPPLERLTRGGSAARYFYVDAVGKYVPVPDVPKRFNEQLVASATQLAATQVRSSDWAALPSDGAAGTPRPAWAARLAEWFSQRLDGDGMGGVAVSQKQDVAAARQRERGASAADAGSCPQGRPAPRAPPERGARDWRVLEDVAEWSVADRQMRYGANEMRIPVKGVARLVFDEMWHPFYVFQYFSIVVWVAGDNYWTYAICIFVITWFSIITSAVEAHSNMKRLADIAYFATEVEVLRGGRFVKLPSPQLVPGDVVAVGPGVMSCDAVLIRGEVIVDENMLTGESVPVRKVPFSPASDGLSYGPDRSSACTLYGGTAVAQARAPKGQAALAMVVRTRFYSAKGQLLRWGMAVLLFV
ncbi:hypothetical protein MNEG_7481 [Monoraphidium neglectum]|uniref:Cation-transporting ATPase n=1 Tax=Monoraphidium neglectum TaxID=145388 RepID=A0A0D2MB27_9CHLO|nr:hypothetical protein MNEG_7481 [Monoraphidium neglectum]KIZ00480.1 hypothetical protein MNEG_7481 [Monoraphidium neglectum]|eukprot:XP_013899499.1 hypothetical protein MNEG_7481 [Monoraphidium neglectum]